jgi:hypothetical protein
MALARRRRRCRLPRRSGCVVSYGHGQVRISNRTPWSTVSAIDAARDERAGAPSGGAAKIGGMRTRTLGFRG